MAENVMLQEAIEAIRQGQRGRARDLLTRLLRADAEDPEYWLWMSAAVGSTKERIYCLQTALRLDPESRAARKGLILLGALPAGDLSPTPLIRRRWEAAVPQPPPKRARLRTLALGGLTLLAAALILAGIFGLPSGRRLAVSLRPSATPGPPPTFTPTPTSSNRTPRVLAPTATFAGPPPLWVLLDATYTPTPAYVNTPHPVSEAYRIAKRAIERGEWETAITNLEQASQSEPEAPDLPYQIGEIQRRLGRLEAALAAYEQAIEKDPSFAPAYLGRARARLALDPEAEVADDLAQAIEMDPNFGEARLEQAALEIRAGETEAALEDLRTAERLLPGSPLVYLYRAQAALQAGEAEAALGAARRSNELDQTLVPTYLTLGEAALAAGDFAAAAQALQTYVTYAPETAAAWGQLGQAYLQSGRSQEAREALDRALGLDESLPQGRLYRGLALLELGEAEAAAEDLAAARREDPGSFPAHLGLARARFAASELPEARRQLEAAEGLAETQAEQAEVFYWRGQVHAGLGDAGAALQDWEALLALPEDAVPAPWRVQAAAGRRSAQATVVATRAPRTPAASPSAVRTSTPRTGATASPTAVR